MLIYTGYPMIIGIGSENHPLSRIAMIVMDPENQDSFMRLFVYFPVVGIR